MQQLPRGFARATETGDVVTGEGRVVVLDFSLVSLVSAASDGPVALAPASVGVRGTPPFARFEQLRASGGNGDRSPTRGLPITSLDAGLFFDRETSIGGTESSRGGSPMPSRSQISISPRLTASRSAMR